MLFETCLTDEEQNLLGARKILFTPQYKVLRVCGGS